MFCNRSTAVRSDISFISLPTGSGTPGTSVMKISLSAFSALAVALATSSIDRLNACPVGEKPSGDSSTTLPCESDMCIES
ncbi:hypothetical protein D3C81_1289110 [compost metagenome]